MGQSHQYTNPLECLEIWQIPQVSWSYTGGHLNHQWSPKLPPFWNQNLCFYITLSGVSNQHPKLVPVYDWYPRTVPLYPKGTPPLWRPTQQTARLFGWHAIPLMVNRRASHHPQLVGLAHQFIIGQTWLTPKDWKNLNPPYSLYYQIYFLPQAECTQFIIPVCAHWLVEPCQPSVTLAY